MSNEEVHDQDLDAQFSPEIVKNFKELFPEHGDLTHEEFLQQQASVYQSLQGNERNKGSISDHGQSSDWSQFSGQEGESSRGRSGRSIESQLALDEALARSLEFGDDFSDLYISESISNTAGNTGVSSRGTPISSIGTPSGSPEVRQDDVDPDEMTFEQLQSLGDSIGAESRGLSEGLISRLPSFKYKTGWFSRKKEKEECVICRTEYKKGVYLITLPCVHQYHSKCITRWLKINKICPICKEEVHDY